MSYIVVARLHNEELVLITDDDTGRIKEWEIFESAGEFMFGHILAPLGYEILKVKV